MDMTEISFHPCSAFMYIVDCSKLKDQLDVNALTLIRNKDSGTCSCVDLQKLPKFTFLIKA